MKACAGAAADADDADENIAAVGVGAGAGRAVVVPGGTILAFMWASAVAWGLTRSPNMMVLVM